MNCINIVGNLTRDPESRTTQEGKNVCSFTVAVNRRQRDAEGRNIADFFRVSAWGKMGENCQKYLTKGKKVAVTGSVSLHVYNGQDNTAKGSLEVFASEVEFLSPAGGGENNVQPNMTPVNVDGELPF